MKTTGSRGDTTPRSVAHAALRDAAALILPQAAWFGVDWEGLLHGVGRRGVTADLHRLPGYRGPEADADAADAADACRSGHWPVLGAIPGAADIDVRNAVRGSAACLHNGLDGVDDPRRAWPVVERFVRGLRAVLDAIEAAGSPRPLVYCNGLHHDAQAMRAAARITGAPTVAVEGCCFGGLMYAETQTGVTGNRSTLRRTGAAAIDARAHDANAREWARAFLDDHFRARSSAGARTAADVRRALEIPEGHRVLLLLGQVRSDTTLAYDAPFVDRVTDLASLAAGATGDAGGWTLIVKPHPKERSGRDPAFHRPYADRTYRDLRTMPEMGAAHVRLVEPDRPIAYELMTAADAAIGITSQSLLEFTAGFGRPSVVAGDAFFAGLGFTVDARGRDDVLPAIRRVLDEPRLSEEGHQRALLFVDHMVREALVRTGEPMPAASRERLLGALGL